MVYLVEEDNLQFLKYFFSLLLNLKKATTPFQFLVFCLLFVILALIGMLSLIQVYLPFTYVAL